MKKIGLSIVTLCLLFACTSPKQEQAKAQHYNEPYRPQIHFSPEANWMNDPNGMVYYDGEYHLFYQYYPDSTVWGPMHWGHATSTDMVHWEHLPIALYPDELGYIFSGSAVIDWNNTTGFQKDGEHPPMVAMFTHHLAEGEKAGRDDYQVQSLAYSLDKGRTWAKYEGNPVIPNPGIKDFRDPKAFWHEETQRWIVIFAALDRVRIYSSANLIDWTFESSFGETYGGHGGVWECPDLFKLKVEGTDEEKWVMLLSINPGGANGGSATQYFIGDFDGHSFTAEQPEEAIKWLDHGKDNYAGVTWADIPETDGRRLFIGWMSNWEYGQVVPTKKWRSAMTLPRSLHLIKKENDYVVASRPVKELESIEEKTVQILENNTVVAEEVETLGIPIKTKVVFDLKNATADKFGVELINGLGEKYLIGYDRAREQFFSDRTASGKIDFEERFAKNLHPSPYSTNADDLKLTIYIDKSSVEVFINDGEFVMTNLVFPNEDFNQAAIFMTGGDITVKSLNNTKLKSIW
ncbi:glycoside hydrolase family 32 protein [Roseivirga pacifica]|uniref:glycoside hydrolase family 32 protein n=1 Tax=Roseivirga pacifica TaxID=1267423 RepID=UPI003BAAAE96